MFGPVLKVMELLGCRACLVEVGYVLPSLLPPLCSLPYCKLIPPEFLLPPTELLYPTVPQETKLRHCGLKYQSLLGYSGREVTVPPEPCAVGSVLLLLTREVLQASWVLCFVQKIDVGTGQNI